MVQRVKLMLSKFLLLWFLLFQCFVCRQNVTCLKRFTRYGHYAGEVEDINMTILFYLFCFLRIKLWTADHRQTRSCLLNRYAKK